MCHPISGELLLDGADRVLPGIDVRRWLCLGGDVLDLPGRVPCRRAGHRDERRSRTSSEGASAPARQKETSMLTLFEQQQERWSRVQRRSPGQVPPTDNLPNASKQPCTSTVLRAFQGRGTRELNPVCMGLEQVVTNIFGFRIKALDCSTAARRTRLRCALRRYSTACVAEPAGTGRRSAMVVAAV